jgi:hypothetical protein
VTRSRFSARVYCPALTVVLVLSSAASAGITYTEGADFSGDLGSPSLITPDLDLGLNRVIGTLPTSHGGSRADRDFFRVVLLTGFDISTISLDVSNYVGVPSGYPGGYQIYSYADGNYGWTWVAGDGNFPLSFTLGEPNNIVFQVYGPEEPGQTDAGSFDYTLNINVVPMCPGDLDYDGDVDLSDLAALLANYNMTGIGLVGDIDDDTDVDLSDLAALLAVYGTTCA